MTLLCKCQQCDLTVLTLMIVQLATISHIDTNYKLLYTGTFDTKTSSRIRLNIRECSLNMGGAGAAYFLSSFEGGWGGGGGRSVFSKVDRKIECTIDQINCNINRQIISSTSYLKIFSSNHLSSLSCLLLLQKTTFSFFQP